MFHVKFGHSMPHSEDTAHSKLNYILFDLGHDKHDSGDTAHYKLKYLDLIFKGRPRAKVMKSTERPYMTYYMCFIETCVITCTIQKIQPIKNSITLI